MAYIYKIVNDMNDKVYIGKTQLNIHERFRQHCKDCKKSRNANRPLYRAMRKHGVEHFRIELVEETDRPEEREIFWIDYYDAYHSGYNGTRGGDGKLRVDHGLVIRTYLLTQNVRETAEICNVSADHVPTILRSNNIPIKDAHLILKEKCSKAVGMFEIGSDMILMKFSSAHDAARYLKEKFTVMSTVQSIASRIACVCNGKKKSVCGFYWKYL